MNISVIVTKPAGWTVTVNDGTNSSTHTYPSGTSADAANAAIVAHKAQFTVDPAATVSITI